MKKLSPNDFICGEYYTHNNTNILLYEDNINKTHFLGNYCKDYQFGNGNWGNNKEFRKSTSTEISWLNTCIKAGKYIPFEEINIEPQYEIY
jgi:hypothetical protein